VVQDFPDLPFGQLADVSRPAMEMLGQLGQLEGD